MIMSNPIKKSDIKIKSLNEDRKQQEIETDPQETQVRDFPTNDFQLVNKLNDKTKI